MSEPQSIAGGLATTAGTKAGTKYVVLGSAEEGGWLEAYRVVASSADAAIREYVQRLNGAPAAKEFVAIPERSWKPRKPIVETKQTVKLG
jgi:hypothetical protein